ncbi:hypothetical protein INT47_000294 [Mucor saturninus]|uniref:Uncharacterized protein n=1 Tax=Mucor saturninus TaxID=64648 RepID=A0A8H7UVM1_9FUNG|nr:hypothetical protein INT47_000294 [Mucor saturninus]
MGLFDTRKEHKSMKLVKKLQEEANLEWEREVVRRKEQELNDEAIAKELQAQLEDENTSNPIVAPSSPPPRLSLNASPPPLPSKPRAYNSSVSLGLSTNNNQSSNSLPTSHSFSSLQPKPLYSMQSSSSQPALPPRQHDGAPSKKPVKSYLPSQTYRPELQFTVSSPSPVSSSVFYQQTPVAKPSVVTQPTYHNITTSTADADVPIHMNMPEPLDMTPPKPPQQDTRILQHQPRSSSTIPTVTPYPPTYQRRDSAPISLPLGSNDILQNASYHQNNSNPTKYNEVSPVKQNYSHAPSVAHNYNNTVPVAQNFNNTPPTNQSYNNTPPATQNYNGTPSGMHNYNNNSSSSAPVAQDVRIPSPMGQNFNSKQSFGVNSASAPAQQQIFGLASHHNFDSSQNHSGTTPPSRYSTPIQNSSYSTLPLEKYSQHHSAPTNTTSRTYVQEQGSTTNPCFKKNQSKPVFSNSVLTLKPDEQQLEEHEDDDTNEWDTLPTATKRVHTPPPPPQAVSDDESEYDYSDMIYDRRKEEEVDPFADSFAVPTIVKTLEPSIQIVDPTVLSRQLSTKIAVEDAVEETEPVVQIKPTIEDNEHRVHEEKASNEIVKEVNEVRTYEEKESEEIEERPFQTPFSRPMEIPHVNQTLIEAEEVKVYPTNILRAGAPPQMSATNPYSKKQGVVPTSDYGYYKESEKPKEKMLPKLPRTTSQEDRHITVASIYPDQRVWIRIHPTDTGKILAERIHIIASYQTRRVIKITTKNGRNIALDNSPLFDDWDEIINFVEGESWTVDWANKKIFGLK